MSDNQGSHPIGTLKSLQILALAVPDRRPSPGRLRELLDYNPETGELHWKWRPEGPANWNARYAGKLVGSHGGRYSRTKIDGQYLLLHRVIWALTTGAWPRSQIDHEDLNQRDNRKANLREATASKNAANRRVRRDNRSGMKGVELLSSGKFRARAGSRGRVEYLGTYDTAGEAHAAYERAAQRHFGEFARVA